MPPDAIVMAKAPVGDEEQSTCPLTMFTTPVPPTLRHRTPACVWLKLPKVSFVLFSPPITDTCEIPVSTSLEYTQPEDIVGSVAEPANCTPVGVSPKKQGDPVIVSHPPPAYSGLFPAPSTSTLINPVAEPMAAMPTVVVSVAFHILTSTFCIVLFFPLWPIVIAATLRVLPEGP